MYDESLPSRPPFMWIELAIPIESKTLGNLEVLAYGAYNAMGLIGPEMAGIALVHNNPNLVLATKVLTSPSSRLAGTTSLAEGIKQFKGDRGQLPTDKSAGL